MANAITSTGLTTNSYNDLYAQLSTALEGIYGTDITLTPDSPDGQLMNIFIQCAIDNLDFLTQIYNSFDPDKAVGTSLDARVAINGIQRQAGTHTITPVSITVSGACTLNGLDLYPDNPFTVQDNTGTQFQLLSTQTPAVAGTYQYSFQASKTGAILTTPNTITVPVTVVLGVTLINNPYTYTSLGIDEETDSALRLRRQKSVSLASQGYYNALYASLNNINGITAVSIYENTTDTTNGDGIPGHSIWVIASGGTSAEIANAIYKKRNAGCGMKGSTTYNITQADGTIFTVRWDGVVSETLYIKFNASSLDGINPPNTTAILAQLPGLLAPGVYATMNVNKLATCVQQIDPNTLVTGAGFCLTVGGTYTNTLTNSAKNKQFSILSGNIAITVI